MSRVTLNDIWNVLAVDRDIYDDIKKIEVVPRKIVEMIIEKCKVDEFDDTCWRAVQVEAQEIRQYAESLLKQFEEDDSSNTESSNAEKCSEEPLPFEF